MRTGHLGGGNDCSCVGLQFKPRDVFGNRTLEHLHALRQIADILPQGLGCVIVQRCTAQADRAGIWRDNASQHPREVDLPDPDGR